MIIFAIVSLITCLLTLGLDIPLTGAQIALLVGGTGAGLALGAFVPAVSGFIFLMIAAMLGGDAGGDSGW